MDRVEIIVTQPDPTPTSSSTAINKIANSSDGDASQPRSNLELHFNALNKPSPVAKLSQSNRSNRRELLPKQSKNGAGTTSSSSNYNTPTNSGDESKRPLLPTSSSSTSLQLTKKIKISPAAGTTSSPATTASSTPSPTTTVPNRTNPPSNFPPFIFFALFTRIIFFFLYLLFLLLVLVSHVYCDDRTMRFLLKTILRYTIQYIRHIPTFACACLCLWLFVDHFIYIHLSLSIHLRMCLPWSKARNHTHALANSQVRWRCTRLQHKIQCYCDVWRTT